MTTQFEFDHNDDSPVDLSPWLSWPQCPICAQRRQARCPTCGFAADDFPLADYQELGAASRSPLGVAELQVAGADLDAAVLLMCPLCEEAFRPRFYDRCAACGYNYGEGVRADAIDNDLAPRVVWAAAGLLAFLAVLCLYFATILRP